jgi:hypothetical protein
MYKTRSRAINYLDLPRIQAGTGYWGLKTRGEVVRIRSWNNETRRHRKGWIVKPVARIKVRRFGSVLRS